MNWYRKAQEKEDLHISKQNMPDRVRFLLKRDKDGSDVGKLTIQTFDMDKKYYYLTAFWIDEEYRGQGWGKQMIEMALSDPRFDKPILVRPSPYGQDAEATLPGLISMYKYFGFKDFQDDYLIYGKNGIKK